VVSFSALSVLRNVRALLLPYVVKDYISNCKAYCVRKQYSIISPLKTASIHGSILRNAQSHILLLEVLRIITNLCEVLIIQGKEAVHQLFINFRNA